MALPGATGNCRTGSRADVCAGDMPRMTVRRTRRERFVARQAVFLRQRGAEADTVYERLGETFGAQEVTALRESLEARPGSFREALERATVGLGIPPEALSLPGLELEQAVGDAYLGLWRGMMGFASYALGLASVATAAFIVLVIFVVPQFETAFPVGVPQFSRMFFELGFGTVLLVVQWLLVLWTFASVIAARRAILLRAWSASLAYLGLLSGVVERHRILLHAWSAGVLLRAGVDPLTALDRATDAVAQWSRLDSAQLARSVDRSLLDSTIGLGTLSEELQYRVETELTDAPLEMAAERERLALYAGIAAAFLVVPMILALYLMVFKIAAAV